MPSKTPRVKLPHWVRATQNRLKIQQNRLTGLRASVEAERVALTNPDLTIGRQMHHMACLRFRERDVRNALGRIELLERSTTYEDYMSYPALEDEIHSDKAYDEQVFFETYTWAAEQYAAKGDNANAAKMRKQARHWMPTA